MNREIKFRAWDGRRMRLSDSGSWTHDFGALKHFFYAIGRSEVVMQFTGLKDKNGKEIYEGDTIKDTSGNIGKIFWADYGWLVEFERDMVAMEPEDINLWAEVIGNIYENPELLSPTI